MQRFFFWKVRNSFKHFIYYLFFWRSTQKTQVYMYICHYCWQQQQQQKLYNTYERNWCNLSPLPIDGLTPLTDGLADCLVDYEIRGEYNLVEKNVCITTISINRSIIMRYYVPITHHPSLPMAQSLWTRLSVVTSQILDWDDVGGGALEPIHLMVIKCTSFLSSPNAFFLRVR